MKPYPVLRVARPSDDPDASLRFYEQGLGFRILSRFKNHDGFDGVMLGLPGAPYHFEFTRRQDHLVGKAPTSDNLCVFYFPDPAAWAHAMNGMRSAGFEPVKSFNPYWDQSGATFEDPDGYRVVLQQAAWEA